VSLVYDLGAASRGGRWRLRAHKQAVREPTPGRLLGELIGLYHSPAG
jgi:hypothetical protein